MWGRGGGAGILWPPLKTATEWDDTLLNHAVYGLFIQRQPMSMRESTADRSAM